VASLHGRSGASPELLSPAGDWEAMRAAVANGADAVYFGLDQFNARHRATNFRLDELDEIVQYLHSHNVKGFLTLNTLIFSDELADVQAYVRRVAEAGVDAVIVQDLGLCRLIAAIAPTLEIHGSTQMTLTEPRGVEWVRRLGVTRAVLGRELSLDEIRKTAIGLSERERATGLRMPDLEVFVHGALCVSYSGQCLTSESLGGRSANRGQCAQACRLPYDLIVDGEKRDLGEKAYLLSPQDLAAYELVGDLTDAGVACLKIEGRLKAAHYVAATTQTYRAALDAARANRPYLISPQQRADLEQTFSRGFTHGFLSGVNHQELVHARFPKSRGRRIGTVEAVRGKTFIITLDPSAAAGPLSPGDGIVFDEGHPDQDEQGGRVFTLKPLGKGRIRSIEVELFRGDANLSAVSVGAIVWKTDDPALRKRLEHSFSRDLITKRVALTGKLVARVGERLRLELRDGVTTAHAEWAERPLEMAQKHPADAKSIREQLSRLGDTPYDLGEIEIELTGGPMIPKSVLNDLRRECVEQLLAGREARRGHAVVDTDPLGKLRGEARRLDAVAWASRPCSDQRSESLAASPQHGRDGHATESPALHVLVRDLEQLDAVLAWRDSSLDPRQLLAGIYADYEDVRHYRDAVGKCRAAGVPITLATVRVIKPREEGFTRFILDCKPDALLVRNLASLAVAQELAPGLPLIGDYALNVSNELTAALFVTSGVRRLVPSYDLSWKQMRAMLGRIDPGFFECVVHQHMPMFHMEHCVFSHTLSDGTDYRTCGRPCERHRVELKDRVGEGHPLLADVGCRNTVFNARAQSALEYIPEMLTLGIRHLRIELLREPAHEVAPLLDRYTAVILGREQPKLAIRSLKVVNQLGVVAGTLDRE
jgi:putative protease